MDLLEVLATAGISAVMSALTGLCVRAVIERKYLQAAAAADESRKNRVRYTELCNAWMWAAGRVLYHLVRWAQGRKPNGDLERSFCELEDIEKQLKSLDRQRSAQAQEEE